MSLIERLALIYSDDFVPVNNVTDDRFVDFIDHTENDILYNYNDDDEDDVVVSKKYLSRPTTGRYDVKYHIAKKILKFNFSVAEHQIFWQLIRPFLNLKVQGQQRNIKYDFIFVKIFNLMTVDDTRKLHLISLCKPVKCKSVLMKYEQIYNNIIRSMKST